MYDRTAQLGRFFDRQRRRYLGASAKFLLLKLDGAPDEFSTEETLTSAWTASYSEYYGSTTFTVARTDEEFNNLVSDSEVSHCMVIDSDNEALNNLLHEIDRETTIPAGVEPYWKIRASAKGRKIPADVLLLIESGDGLLFENGNSIADG